MGGRERKTSRQAEKREGPGERAERNGKERHGDREGSGIPGGPFIHSTHLAVAGDNTNRTGQWGCLYTK